MSDQHVRDRVRSEFSANYCLSAGAGAGKTEELTRRAAHWLIYGAPKPLSTLERQQGLVLLTFTEAGAAEMGDRIEGLLHQLAQDEGWTETTPGLAAIGAEIESLCELDRTAIQKRAAALLDGPSIRVSTFHSFCLDLLRDFGETIGLPARLELESNDKALAVVRRTMAWETLADEIRLADRGLFAQPIRSDWVVQILCELSRSPWLPNDQLDTIEERLGVRETTDDMAQLIPDLRLLQSHFSGFGKGAKKRIATINALLENAESTPPDWDELAKQLEGLAKIKAVPSDELRERVQSLRARCALRSRWSPAFWSQLLPHIPRLLRRLRSKQVFHRRIGFDDALRYAVELLRSRPSVRRLCRQQIHQMMVDEFQDTDPLQCELLRAIHQDDAGRFVPGRLFIVGDDKQSIYAFRGADLKAYQQFCAELLEHGAQALELKRNFRSDLKVLDAVAGGFEEHFGPAAKMRGRHNARQGSTRYLGWHKPPHSETKTGRLELQNRVAALVAQRLDAEPSFKASDCAILARTRAQVEVWCQVLRAHGVPAIAVGGRDGLRHEALHDLLNLLAFIAGESDSASFFGLLQSPLFNWHQHELQTALESNFIHQQDLELCHLENRQPQLRALFALRDLYAVGALVELRSQLLINNWCPGPWSGDSQRSADLIRLMDQFFEAAADPKQRLLVWLERQREAPDFAPEVIASEGVVVMTLHGAKGLEWPWVIAASMPAQGGSGLPDPSETHDRQIAINISKGPWIGPLLAIQSAKKAQSITEDRRLAYVACTRARNDLWIIGRSDGGSDPLDDLIYDAEKRGECEPIERLEFAPKAIDYLSNFEPSTDASEAWQRAKPLSVSPSQIDAEHGERHRREDARDDEPNDRPSQRRTVATAVGELVHLVLEQLDFSQPLSAQVASGTERALAQMMEQLPNDQMLEIFESAHDALNRFAQTPLAREFEDLEIVVRELAFTCPAAWLDEGSSARIGTGFIDLIYRRGDGRLVVADWKVTQETDHDKLIERYRRQLEAYRRVVQRLCPNEPIDTELILVRSGERVLISQGTLEL